MKFEKIVIGMKIRTHINELGIVKNILVDSIDVRNSIIKVEIQRESLFHKKGEIVELLPHQLSGFKTIILVRPDDFAFFLENDDFTYSHENGSTNLRYDKNILLSLGFHVLQENDHAMIKHYEDLQKKYVKYLLWYNQLSREEKSSSSFSYFINIINND